MHQSHLCHTWPQRQLAKPVLLSSKGGESIIVHRKNTAMARIRIRTSAHLSPAIEAESSIINIVLYCLRSSKGSSLYGSVGNDGNGGNGGEGLLGRVTASPRGDEDRLDEVDRKSVV